MRRLLENSDNIDKRMPDSLDGCCGRVNRACEGVGEAGGM